MPLCIDYQTVTLLNVEDFGIYNIFERSWHDVKYFLVQPFPSKIGNSHKIYPIWFIEIYFNTSSFKNQI